jgi:CubicO group peptidase (beta-lactamase class C family)
MPKTLLWLVAAIVLAMMIAAGLRAYGTALVGSGYSAEILCGAVFVSGREPAAVEAEDLSGPGLELAPYFDKQVERDAKRVAGSFHGLAAQIAIFRDGFGCTRINRGTAADLPAASAVPSIPPPDPAALWPEGERVDLATPPDEIDLPALNAAVASAFAEPDPAHPRNTRALVVVHRGRIVAERYAPGFGTDTPLIAWSMAKGAANALIGLRVKDGKLAVTDKGLLPEWRGAGDRRAGISLDDLLRMSSGLAFDESYNDPLGDVTEMLFVAGDMAKFAAKKTLRHAPGSYWNYSSGTTVLLARVLRETFATEADYLRYPHERLFGPLGMRSAVLETDASGTFVASSLLYASARDFARLGLLFLQDGVWRGERLLPERWVAYTLAPTKAAPDESYGAQMWLKLPESDGYGEPPLPADAFYFLGYDEQIIAVVPSRDLVIVRLGLTQQGGDWDHARDLAPIVVAVPRRGG